MTTLLSLPIDALLPELVASLRASPRLVLVAPPGAGKTTRVPRALLAHSLFPGELLVLQPRRLAARLAARRVADELGENLGHTVGYQVRFDEISSPATRIRFITEGILTRRLLHDPTLRGVGAVLLDEFHERHLASDLGLALLRRLQRGPRPDLGLLVMSATLEAVPIARFLHDCPVLTATGRPFAVTLEHLETPDPRPLPSLVAAALARLLREGLSGDVLVFLPGAAEIRACLESCARLADAEDLLLLPLHGELTAAEQDRAVSRAAQRKVIFSTNVAETSVTIDGVVAVVDSGLARVAGHSPWSGLPTLQVARISQASATQRAGRAGRTAPGRCLRLYTRADFESRPPHDRPEILRLDLAESVLELKAAGVGPLSQFEWLQPPPPAALDAAQLLLRRLGALDETDQITPLGQKLLQVPLHPRQSRLLVEAASRGVGTDGAVLAALLGERELCLNRRARGLREGTPRSGPSSRGALHDAWGPSDLLHRLDLFREATRGGVNADRARALELDIGAVAAVDRARQQLTRLLGRLEDDRPSPKGQPGPRPLSPAAKETALLISTLAGWPDRVARRRTGSLTSGGERSRELIFAFGGNAVLSDASVVGEAELLLAVDAEEQPGKASLPLVRLASEVKPDWLLELFLDQVEERREVRWNARLEKVEASSRLLYGNLVLEESGARASEAEAAAVLWEAARGAGAAAFAPEEGLERLRARGAFLRQAMPELSLPGWEDEAVLAVLQGLCAGRSSFAELRDAGMLEALLGGLRAEQRRALDKEAPERLTLPGGRTTRVEYPPDGPPYVASRLQDFFGLKQGPSLAAGRVPLVLHLLAPNQRPVQVTRDLAGFWERHYPALRRELGRRYPRHAWPEDPLTASPPAPRGR